jgi:hypothetical protein
MSFHAFYVIKYLLSVLACTLGHEKRNVSSHTDFKGNSTVKCWDSQFLIKSTLIDLTNFCFSFALPPQ